MADLTFSGQDGISRSISDTPPAHYIVKFQLFSLLAKNNIEKYNSGDFEAGGFKWRLVVHPNGNKSKNITDHISFYLMLAEGASFRPGWEIHAVFRLYLLDQTKDNYLILQHITEKGKRFHGLKSEWGFDRFISLTAFNDPSNGYLLNDTSVFGAEVYVCQENITGRGECLSMIKDPISFKHTWKIENFSKITSECEDSKLFNAGDEKWKIQLYPKGKGSGTGSYISLYLALADPTSLAPGSKIYAEFTLRILDQINAKHYFGKANYWFSPSNTACGWPRFVSLSYFNLAGIGLLVKDNCFVEAEVSIHGTTNAL